MASQLQCMDLKEISELQPVEKCVVVTLAYMWSVAFETINRPILNKLFQVKLFHGLKVNPPCKKMFGNYLNVSPSFNKWDKQRNLAAGAQTKLEIAI